jgi:ATP-binding cassette subfamily B protein
VIADHLPERPASRDWSQFLRLARFLGPYKLRIAGAIASLLVAASSVLALGQGLRYVIDAGFGSANATILDTALAGVLALAVLLACATWARFYLMMTTGERVIADIRRAVYGHVLSFSPAFFESARTAEVISRLTNDTTLLQGVIGFGFSMAVRNALLLVGAVAMLLVTNLKLTLVVLAFAPLLVAAMLLVGRRVRRHSRENQDRVADVSVHADESLHEIRTVQSYVHEEASRREFGALVEAAYASGVERIAIKALLIGFVMLVVYGGVAVVLWIGGHDVLAGKLSAGDLSAFVFYCAVAAGGVAAISEVYGDLQRAAGATERLMELLETGPQIVAPAAPRAVPQAIEEVGFDAVDFAYPARPQSAALQGFSLRIPAGQRVALVGPSGAGKTTVLALLLRFYDPQSGAVRVNGFDAREFDPLQLRRLFAVVPQEPVIFASSVLENVRYGRPGATADEVRIACERAFAAEFIDRLPRGYDTPLGERGVTLSGGQRQRLSIARALLADRPVLLLDEATSSLDAASERMVQQALEALEAGRTTIVIAHRLATVQHADRIVVMERGAIQAEGTHGELMREGGLYASLARLQFLATDAHGAGDPGPRLVERAA